MAVIELKQAFKKQIQDQSLVDSRGTTALHATTMSQGLVLLAKETTVSLPATERFRMLRAKIERFNLGKSRFSVIAFTSAVPQEGKSVVSVNTARALSLDPVGKTLLIDADMRRPSVHRFLSFSRNDGLSDLLLGLKNLSEVIRPVSSTFDVITAGQPVPDPTRVLDEPNFERYLTELRTKYRYIIIDCPPVLVCPEPITMTSLTDTTIMVVRAWRTERKLVKDAVDAIGKENIMGFVLNDGEDASKQYLDYGYYGAAAVEPAKSE